MRLTVCFALAGIATCLAATKGATLPESVATASAPRIAFASTAYDFGKIKAGELAEHDFVFTNIGTATLEILAVKPACGCTSSGTWTKKAKAGKTGVIALQFNSANFSGHIEKQAIVMCNDPGQSNVVLEVSGTVWKPIDVSASMVAFILSTESEVKETKVVHIVSNLDEPFKLSDPQCTNESFHAELTTVKQGKEFELRITAMRPPDYSSIAAPITVQCSSPKMPMIDVIAYVMVQQPVTVIPPKILLLGIPLSNPVHEIVTIRYTGTNFFALSDATVNAPGVSVRIKETESGRSFDLTVEFPAGFEVEQGEDVEVSAKSNHPKFPLIKVPIFVPPASSASQTRSVGPANESRRDESSSRSGAKK